MLSKSFKVILMFMLVVGIGSFNGNSASAAKVMWGKTELKLGQVGKITVLSNSSLVKLESDGSLTTVRTLKKGEEFRVYSYKSNQGGLYGVGGGSYIQKNSNILYETPSKSKLALLKNQGAILSISEETFNMSVSEVEKSESAKFLSKVVDEEITQLTYETKKFGYYAHLKYYFLNGKIKYIVYDFLPDRDSYNTWNEMNYLYNQLHTAAVKELGKDYSASSTEYSSLFTRWKKSDFDVLLQIDDENFYTKAQLIYYQQK
ncbi:hypothetical protein ACFVR1_11585 [Psychrobacillus sp. NPDC058041]|uniref:hypothetical protein n=1 Tax=Psychrobacillus sp. NPDC058041 TaxID=3346310 RepID=UPI0036DB7CD8